MDIKEFDTIMDMAIAAEVEAYEFYSNVAAISKDASMKKIFGELAQEESGHKVSLESIKAKELQNFSFTAATDYKISATVEMPKLSMDLKPVDAIALAMKKEEEYLMIVYKDGVFSFYAKEKESIKEYEKIKEYPRFASIDQGSHSLVYHPKEKIMS